MQSFDSDDFHRVSLTDRLGAVNGFRAPKLRSHLDLPSGPCEGCSCGSRFPDEGLDSRVDRNAQGAQREHDDGKERQANGNPCTDHERNGHTLELWHTWRIE